MTTAQKSIPHATERSLVARSAATAARFGSALVVVVAVWAALSALVDVAIPSPSAVIDQVRADGLGFYRTNATITLREAAWGFVWGNLIGIALGVCAFTVPWLERSAMMLATFTFTVPAVALGAVFATVLSGSAPRIVLSAVFVVYLTTQSTLLGLRSADRAAVDLARTNGLGPVRRFVSIRVPGALPVMAPALAVAATSAVLGAVVGEYLGGEGGLGLVMVASQRSGQVARTWAIALVAAALAWIMFTTVRWIGRRAVKWEATLSSSAQIAGARRPSRHPVLIGTVLAVQSVAVAITVWYGAIWLLDIDPFVSTTPADVARHLLDDPQSRGEVFSAVAETLRNSAFGLVAGMVAAIGLAIVFVHAPRVERFVLPIAVFLQSVPFVAFLPVAVIVFGRGIATVAIVSGLVSFFPVLTSVTAALRRTAPAALDVMQCAGFGTLTTLSKARIPFALPAMFGAARLAIPSSIAGALLVEWLAIGSGAGHIMLVSSTTFAYRQLWSVVVVITLITLASTALLGALERRFTHNP